VDSIVEKIKKFIDFLIARIEELQRFIRKINDLLQSILNFSVVLPECSGLMLVSNGTNGLVGDLMSANNKPFDGPDAFGAGVAMVLALAPGVGSIVTSFLPQLFPFECREPGDGSLSKNPAPGVITVETIPAIVVVPDDAEPDVL